MAISYHTRITSPANYANNLCSCFTQVLALLGHSPIMARIGCSHASRSLRYRGHGYPSCTQALPLYPTDL